MARDDQSDEAFASSFMRPFIAFGVIMVFSTQPMVRYANPWLLSVAGFITGLGFAYLLISQLTGATITRTKGWSIMGVIGCGFGLFVLSMVFANITSNRVDHQCALLEIDMFKTAPARKDSRELYQALQCRPQSRGTLWFPANKGFRN